MQRGTTYTYDHNGNTLTSTTGSNTTTYAWDFENRLTSVTLPGSGGTVSFKYDPFGRRIYKSSSNGTSVFAYDGDDLVEETNSSGAVVARYSQGLNVDEPFAMLRSSTTSYYHADGLGSVTSLTSVAGSLIQTYGYDSFGKQTGSSGSLTNPFQYTARESDAETSLYFYRARYYDAAVGRFLSEDPIKFKGGFNFYSYVRNRSLNLSDPLGLNPNWGTVWRIIKNSNKVHEIAGQITCVADCFDFCVPTLCDNSKSIGQAQGGGPPVYLPGDLANQGNSEYTGAPLASEGVRQIRMAAAGNTTCKECLEKCLPNVLSSGMFPK